MTAVWFCVMTGASANFKLVPLSAKSSGRLIVYHCVYCRNNLVKFRPTCSINSQGLLYLENWNSDIFVKPIWAGDANMAMLNNHVTVASISVYQVCKISLNEARWPALAMLLVEDAFMMSISQEQLYFKQLCHRKLSQLYFQIWTWRCILQLTV